VSGLAEDAGRWRAIEIMKRPLLALALVIGSAAASVLSAEESGHEPRLRDALVGKGHDVDYREFNGKHSYVNWRESFGEALALLLEE
jgi:enterochelin esterase-like enzyme